MAFYTIHPREISDVVLQKKAIVIDVREREDYREYHYKDAVNCPYEEMERWIWRFPKNRILVLYCEYGSTSLLAARKLSHQGFEVYTVVGGIQAIKSYLALPREAPPRGQGKLRD